MRSSNLPEHSASSVVVFCLVLLRMGFGLLRLVAKCTVRSYRTFSPLPVLPVFTSGHRRYGFLFHFPSRCRARPLAGILLFGARTFLPACLTRCAATVCFARVRRDYSMRCGSLGNAGAARGAPSGIEPLAGRLQGGIVLRFGGGGGLQLALIAGHIGLCLLRTGARGGEVALQVGNFAAGAVLRTQGLAESGLRAQ